MNLTERANLGLHGHVLAKARLAAPERSASIVDIGCGTGALLAQLRSHGYTDLSGVDISPPADLEGIGFHSLDLDNLRLPFADQSVDLALAVEVIEHLENPGSFFAELRRVLRPSGMLLMTTPNVHSVEARVRLALLGQLKQFDAIGDPTHIHPVFRFPFVRLVTRHGFLVADSWGYPEDGSSPTSRGALRYLAGFARLLGLRGGPDGDQLCMLLKLAGTAANQDPLAKQAALTAHY